MLVYSSMRRTFGPDTVASGSSVTPSLRHSISIGKSPSVTVQTDRSLLPRVKFLGKVNDSMTGATTRSFPEQTMLCKNVYGADFFAVVVEGVRWWWWWVGAVRSSAWQCNAKLCKVQKKWRKKERKRKKVKLNWLLCDRCNYNSSDVGMQLILSRFRFRCSGFRFHSDLLFLKNRKAEKPLFPGKSFESMITTNLI